jgi:hypothetical protein
VTFPCGRKNSAFIFRREEKEASAGKVDRDGSTRFEGLATAECIWTIFRNTLIILGAYFSVDEKIF